MIKIIVFTEEQENLINEAVDWFYNKSEQLFEISGGAGTGKSVTLNEIIKRLDLCNFEYVPVAYTGAAAMVMKQKGMKDAATIHSVFFQLIEVEDDTINTKFNTKRKIRKFIPRPVGTFSPSIKLIVVDEAFMVPFEMRNHILKHGIKVIACGDAQQLPPVSSSRSAFLNGMVKIHWLTAIMRQDQNNPLIWLANRAIHGEPIHSGWYDNKVLVIDREYLTDEMVLNAGNIICGTNRTRDFINHRVRELLGKQSDFPEFGDRIICRKNNWDNISVDGYPLVNGLQGYVCYPISMKNLNYYGKKSKIDIINNVLFKADFVDFPYTININYDFLRSNYSIRKEMMESKFNNNKFANLDNAELFEYAYAISVHLSQGSEYNSGIFIDENMGMDKRSFVYTAITRFKNFLIYVKPPVTKYY